VAGATPWPSTPTPNGGATATADGDRPLFATALRGYERNQVDDYLTQRDKELSGLRAELADLRAERDRAVSDAESVGKELREARAKSAHLEPAAKEDSFGFRAEKLLRIAEQEAADIRASDARRRLDEATKEISRLSGLQADVRSELAQLAQLITTELATARAQVAAKDGAAQNGAAQNGAAKDGAARDGAAQRGAAGNGSPASGGSRDRK